MATVLITGATSGIGRATTIALDAAGFEVVAAGRHAAGLEALRAERPRIATRAFDLADGDAARAAVADLRVDVLVNNAGIMPPPGPFAAMTEADIDTALAVNLRAALLLTRLVVPQMRARRSGHIVFVGSTAGHAPAPGFAVYAATKAAVSSFCASLRAELSRFDVRVTELVPGRVETALYRTVLDEDARAALYADAVALQPDDVAAMVVAVLALPPSACVARLDIVPTRPTIPVPIRTDATP